MLLILTAALNATPAPATAASCAALAYCLAERRQMFFLIYDNRRPAGIMPAERAIYALADRMVLQGCAVPDDLLDCDAPPPASVAPPVDCATLVLEDER